MPKKNQDSQEQEKETKDEGRKKAARPPVGTTFARRGTEKKG